MAEKFVDIENLIREKNPNLLNYLPGFVIKYLRKIIHEEDVNYEIDTNRHTNGIGFANMVVRKFHISIEIVGEENIPKKGRQILVANHPIGSIDSCALVSILGQYRTDMYFLANDLLQTLPSMRDLLIPVNKHGSNRENIEIINKYFDSDALMLFYPAGLVSRRNKGVIMDLEWKSTCIKKAVKHKRDVIPVYIEGRVSNFFYNLYSIRKFFGIKQAIEMLYLVDEMYKQDNNTIKFIFGKPIPYQQFDNTQKEDKWTQLVKEHVYHLSTNCNISF